MRYESEILYDLMKRDGLLNPSQDNLPYESELKEKYVNDVVGAYPKLQDYRPEWLNYNKCEYIPADFPTESQTNQTSGTFENVIPFGYDVATLKGQTLVNIVNKWNEGTGSNSLFTQNINVKKGQIYTVIGKIESSDIDKKPDGKADVPAFRICTGTDKNGESLVYIQQSDAVINQTFTNNENDTIHLRFFNQKTNYKKLMIIEGDYTNVDIPYFEGMQSVQMPVLTTTGKNLYNKEIHQRPSIMGADSKLFYATDYIPVLPNTTYTKSNGVRLELCDSNKVSLGGMSASTFTTTSDTYYIRYNVLKTEIDTHQLEQGSTATSYEPYQSIIVSAPSDLELRGVGDVKDELNLLTGEVNENIIEVTVDSNTNIKGEKFPVSGKPVNTSRYAIDIKATFGINVANRYGLSDKIPYMNTDDDTFHFKTGDYSNYCFIYVPISELETDDWAGFVKWAKNKNFKLLLKRSEKSIKTVDLSCINENNVECDFMPFMDTMHYQTSSNTIPPLVDLTVCVEATTQNLASFVNLEGVEHDG